MLEELGGANANATSTNNTFTLDDIDRLTASKYTTANTDYKTAMLEELADKRDAQVTKLNGVSSAAKDALDKKIKDKDTEIFAADKRRNEFYLTDGTFRKVIDLTKANSKIFNYNNGYNNTNLSKLLIPTGCEVIMIENTGDVCLIFKNKGDNQTPYTFSVPASGSGYTCDILVVGGGGGGGAGHGGGGGAGQLVLVHQAILKGTYTVKVGKGGNGTKIIFGGSVISAATKGNNSEFGNTTINVIAEGGGANGGSTLKDGGSGAGGDGHIPDSGVPGKGLKNTTIDTFFSGTVYSRGNDGGDGGLIPGQGGGGGGAGAAGTTGGNYHNSTIGHGGDGLSGISAISYDFKTNFGNYGKLETDGNYWFAGGGAGGIYYTTTGNVSNGGKGGGGSTPPNGINTPHAGESGMNGTGGGGAGGSAHYGSGGDGGSGIVIIKIKNIIQSPDINSATDNYYKIDKSIQNPYEVSIAPYTIQTDIITAFVFLQKGYYRFRADLGTNTNGANPSIKYAQIMIYDESNFDNTTSKYKCVPVFRYNRQLRPAYLKQYVHIPTSKFFKIAYFYVSHNPNANIDSPPFNLYYDYSATYQQQTYPEDIISSPNVSSYMISNTDKYMIFNYTGDNTGRGQTQYTFATTEALICDILIVGGGGGGGGGHGGGGGAGQLILIHQATLNGTYTVKVGKGGVRGTNPATGGIEPTKGSNSSFDYVIAEGGGANGGNAAKDGGSGAGGDSWLNGLGVKGKGLKNTTIHTYSSGTVYSRGNDGGGGGTDPGQGAGGGGAGTSGGEGANWYTNGGPGNGGNGLSGISEISYDFKRSFGTTVGKLETDNLVYFAGGGGGGAWFQSIVAIGGKGGGGDGGSGLNNGVNNGKDAVNNTGSGGGGGSGNYGMGGNGGSGIVIIRYRLPIQQTSAITLKDLNNNMNDSPDLYVSNNITNNIKTSMNDYLYYSSTLYNDYKNTDTTVMDIFSIMNYTGNNKDNYRYLATYLNNKVDYFNTDKLLAEKKEFQRQLQTHIDTSSTTITGDQEIIKIDNLSNNIKAINYNEKKPMNAPKLLDNVPIKDIFCSSNNNIYLTYDTITNLNGINLLTPNLTPAIYIEAIT
jgi:hypothetical protein